MQVIEFILNFIVGCILALVGLFLVLVATIIELTVPILCFVLAFLLLRGCM